MPLFGHVRDASADTGAIRAFRLDQAPYKPLEAQPMGDKSQAGQRSINSAAGGSATPGAAGGGWRGAFMRKNLGRTLGIAGAAFQQISDPNGQLDAFSANEADQQRQAAVEAAMQQRTINGKDDRAAEMEDRALSREAAQYEAAQRQQMEQYIASLPPDQQLLARLNREGFVNGMMRHRYPAPRSSGADGIADDDGWTYHD